MKLVIKKGTTSYIDEIFIEDITKLDTIDPGLTGLVFNTSNLVAHYTRQDQGNVGATAITLATMTRGTWASGGFIAKDTTNLHGHYQIGIPDAVLAVGASWATITLQGAANMKPVKIQIQLVDNTAKDIYDEVSLQLFTVVADGSNTATTFKTDLTQTSDNYWRKPQLVRFRTGNLAGQTQRLTATGYNGTSKFLTVDTAFLAAPDTNSIGEIISR